MDAESWGSKGSLMFSKLVILVCSVALIGLCGCSGKVADKGAPIHEPRITEEDLPNSRAPQTPRDQEPPPPVIMGGPEGTPTGEVSPSAGPGSKQPRRYLWKDKKGSERGWEPSQVPSEKDK
jgi:hypothetical protein